MDAPRVVEICPLHNATGYYDESLIPDERMKWEFLKQGHEQPNLDSYSNMTVRIRLPKSVEKCVPQKFCLHWQIILDLPPEVLDFLLGKIAFFLQIIYNLQILISNLH